ncbi:MULTISPECIES: GNAT family N-acetyltransferase [Rhizobium]|uniref:GNAT family N-acetyltransferase n=1 Tax=Rhizobium rhododendri TaxID=2506430 RepID=A0ABY8IE82_9HYPH|nr:MULTISPECIES: GNAT family N-acetyltransferase [Rhizobium]MBZ5758684.1 GNAT family N-acetyltransferase [Rhizobium sp. VS19-DR96]MBZ5764486.1 GNAT family N-acetyltransferase [Rhizobium sp. VS19-DR129.2]MBZ5772029.1 GNAT family N-acetyltransferase [Rhizobium sp. VS19-DRK62.2]MBZ5783284.1 GNAT family N-acetyltransferase [Rhizobium sp. VS19-DR121]MBZ5800732.1 GNAT family N-acetyltransferase [Rhizobium sp. VS19-DR181]
MTGSGEAGFAVRQAEASDLDQLLDLYRQLNPADPEPTADAAQTAYAEMLAQPGLRVFLGTADHRPVSTATLLIIPNLTRGTRPYALIENVVTLEEQRSKGYGRTVMLHAIDVAFTAGCYKVMLLTERQREHIHRFYESCGFTQNKAGFQIRND